MLSTQAFAILSLLAGSTLVSAHGHVKQWTVNGVTKPGFNPSNAALYGATANRPTDNSDQGFTDYTGTIVACGSNNAGTGIETWDVNAGSTVTATWDQWPDSHKGSIAEYMARCPDTGCDGVAAASLDWFKISEKSFSGGRWPTQDVTAAPHSHSFVVPAQVAAGFYLIRHDLLAMHSTGEPQVYPVCIQANIISTGSVVPSSTVKFPAAYSINTDFLTHSLYGGDQSAFVPPGPAVYNFGAGGNPPPVPAPSPSPAPVPVPSSSAAPVPEPVPSSSAAPVPAPEPVPSPEPEPIEEEEEEEEEEYPEPAPEPSSAPAPIPVPSSSVAPAPAPQPTGSALGGPAQPVSQVGNRWVVGTGSGSYHDQASAVYASCMSQMNKCKNWANTLPNSEVSPAFALCDSQLGTCISASTASKRAVVARYAKRGARMF